MKTYKCTAYWEAWKTAVLWAQTEWMESSSKAVQVSSPSSLPYEQPHNGEPDSTALLPVIRYQQGTAQSSQRGLSHLPGRLGPGTPSVCLVPLHLPSWPSLLHLPDLPVVHHTH